jgi:hypothetical protein
MVLGRSAEKGISACISFHFRYSKIGGAKQVYYTRNIAENSLPHPQTGPVTFSIVAAVPNNRGVDVMSTSGLLAAVSVVEA